MTDEQIATRSREIISEALRPPTREQVERSLRIIAEASARTERARRARLRQAVGAGQQRRLRRLVIGALADVAGEIEMKLRETLARESDERKAR